MAEQKPKTYMVCTWIYLIASAYTYTLSPLYQLLNGNWFAFMEDILLTLTETVLPMEGTN